MLNWVSTNEAMALFTTGSLGVEWRRWNDKMAGTCAIVRVCMLKMTQEERKKREESRAGACKALHSLAQQTKTKQSSMHTVA